MGLAIPAPAPSPLPVPRVEMTKAGNGGQGMRDPGRQASDVLRGAKQAGPVVVLTLACIALAGGLVWLAVQREQTASPDRWTGADHNKYEMQVEFRLAKMDRTIERLTEIVTRQDSMISQLTELVRRQTDQIKALEALGGKR